MNARIINTALRGATLGVRFVFIFFLAKYLSPKEMGYYGLFTAALSYSMYFVGLDFYVYLTREIIKTPTEERGQLLKGQAGLSGILYLLYIPLTIPIVIYYAQWPNYLVWWLIPILLVEHLNQEIFRLLVALSEQVAASVALFIRQASWGLAAVVLMAFDDGMRSLEAIFIIWFIAGVFAALFGIWKLLQMGIGGWQESINWKWVKTGVSTSAAFLIATLALRGMQTFDRYAIESIGGVEVVGAYVLFLGVAGSLLAFLDAGVFSFAYPRLIKLKQDGETKIFQQQVKQLFFVTAFACVAFFAISWVILPYLLAWIGKSIYTNSIDLFFWVALATVLNAIGLVPHFALYASGKDRLIIASHIFALLVFGLAVYALKNQYGYLAVPQGLVTAFLFILIWKTIAYFWTSRIEKR